MTVLSVNLNKVALLRNQRDLTYPSVTGMARLCLAAGAGGITVHPRPDQRHIRPSDVRELSLMLKSEFPQGAEFNIEGYPSEEFLALVEETRSDQVTLVPDDPHQNTSDHGWDIPAQAKFLSRVIERLKSRTRSRVVLFVNDDPAMAQPARDVGADRVELYTGPYHHAFMQGQSEITQSIASFSRTASAMQRAGLGINAGHDLNLDNLPAFLEAIPCVEEVSIGHALTADALIMGMDRAVRSYVDVIAEAQPRMVASQ